ncbi:MULTISPECIES: DNA cytosine methyltransferase [Brevundimonas]|uniref:DNA cytosine methyltransferase n=1 Tax=Brevundimonas TaxID=41275 RepID=UPI001905482B|nr:MULTISPECIES: DNA cytosine methyltransferase [Brevundimonas]MBK1968710.1 DNA cytosine methyltransferase [Brevundimonas diminuta]MDM8353312.1 DNA cytosine methyltransferase [Brevundimonas diminuta]
MPIRPAPIADAGAAFTACEFFAGGGLAGLGLNLDGAGFRTVLANDIDAAKARAFRANHPETSLIHADVWAVTPDQVPGAPDLCWASSPCQDVSLAGARGGLKAQRSGAFWGFWKLMQGLDAEGRAPPVIVLENVVGLLTSGEGQDFAAVCGAMAEAGYTVGALEIDAELWLPQSRPRLFIVAMRGVEGPRLPAPVQPFHSSRLIAAWERLPEATKANWAWWRLAVPPRRNLDLAAVLEADVPCFDAAQTQTLLAMLSPLHRARLETIRASGERRVGAAFRRVRTKDGKKLQRLEMRFDGLAGCLRTPSGGSSRQYVVIVESGRVAMRRLTGREAARLMGVANAYRLPASESAALKLMGDAVAVPVVDALARDLFLPALSGQAEAAA